MEFNKLLSDAAAKLKEKYVKHKMETNFDRYQHSPRLKLSRLYGYRLKDDGKAERVPEEARVVQRVFNMFVEHKTVQEIKTTLDRDGVRTRFSDRWTVGQLLAMIKPLYAGLVAKRLGGFVRSDVYPPLVSQEVFQKAQKEVRRQIEAAEIDPVTAIWGTRKDSGGGRKVN